MLLQCLVFFYCHRYNFRRLYSHILLSLHSNNIINDGFMNEINDKRFLMTNGFYLPKSVSHLSTWALELDGDIPLKTAINCNVSLQVSRPFKASSCGQ